MTVGPTCRSNKKPRTRKPVAIHWFHWQDPDVPARFPFLLGFYTAQGLNEARQLLPDFYNLLVPPI